MIDAQHFMNMLRVLDAEGRDLFEVPIYFQYDDDDEPRFCRYMYMHLDRHGQLTKITLQTIKRTKK